MPVATTWQNTTPASAAAAAAVVFSVNHLSPPAIDENEE